MVNLAELSFCEPTIAGSAGKWCVRRLTKAGRKLGGGVDTASFCGRVDPARFGGWDLGPRCEVSLDHPQLCGKCREALLAEGVC